MNGKAEEAFHTELLADRWRRKSLQYLSCRFEGQLLRGASTTTPFPMRTRERGRRSSDSHHKRMGSARMGERHYLIRGMDDAIPVVDSRMPLSPAREPSRGPHRHSCKHLDGLISSTHPRYSITRPSQGQRMRPAGEQPDSRAPLSLGPPFELGTDRARTSQAQWVAVPGSDHNADFGGQKIALVSMFRFTPLPSAAGGGV